MEVNIENADDIMDELSDLSPDSDETEETIRKTSYNLQQVNANKNFYQGSIKITPALHKKVKITIEERFKAAAPYTKERIARIDRNWEMYGNQNAGTGTESDMFYPDTFNSCEDWVDDLTLIFQNFPNYLSLTDVSNSVEEFIVKNYPVHDTDIKSKPVAMFFSFLKQKFGKEKVDKDNEYYFNKKDLIKAFIKWGVEKSGFEYNHEEFFWDGVISGQFLTKDEYRNTTKDYQIVFNKEVQEDGVEVSTASYTQTDKPVFRFTNVDPRTVVFPKAKVPPWIGQEIDMSIPEILAECLDADGKPKEVSRYDYNRVKMLAKYLSNKNHQSSDETEDGDISGVPQESLSSESEDSNYVDAKFKAYEIHWVPVQMPGSNIAKKTRIYAVNVGDLESPNFYVIGIEETPYVVDFPYHSTPYVPKKNEWAGMGLPEIVETLQDLINTTHSHVTDLMLMGLYGILVLDPDAIETESQIEKITPRMVIRLKNAKGRKAGDIVDWLHPPLDTINFGETYLQRIEGMMKKTSRKGPTGEKVSPQVTATEMMSIIDELKKSVNRVALRVNNHLTKWCERMYIYYILNWGKSFTFKADAYRLWGLDVDELESELDQMKMSSLSEKYRVVQRQISLSPEELLIEGLTFKCDAVDSFQREAVERQQIMQTMDLLYSKGVILNPQTGQPRVFRDENGREVIVSEYKLIKKAADVMNFTDLFVPASNMVMPQDQPEQPGQPGTTGSSVPALNAGTRPQDIRAQATSGVRA